MADRTFPAPLLALLGLAGAAADATTAAYDTLAARGERRLHPPGDGRPATIDLTGVTPGAVLAHDDLPLDDYDHLTLGSLRARLPKLDPVVLAQLRDYERAHAHRLPVLTLLENRLAKVTAT